MPYGSSRLVKPLTADRFCDGQRRARGEIEEEEEEEEGEEKKSEKSETANLGG